jgi:hypothetical protein
MVIQLPLQQQFLFLNLKIHHHQWLVFVLNIWNHYFKFIVFHFFLKNLIPHKKTHIKDKKKSFCFVFVKI